MNEFAPIPPRLEDLEGDEDPTWRPGWWREDTVTNTVDAAARYERERAEAAGEYDDTRPGWGDI